MRSVVPVMVQSATSAVDDESAAPSRPKKQLLDALQHRRSSSSENFLSRTLANVLGCDLRSLALLRILLAGLILWDCAQQAEDVRRFYGDSGVLNLFTVMDVSEGRFSLHFVNKSDIFAVALFTATILSALCLLVGLRTRLAAFCCWLLLLSHQLRNPLIMDGGDLFLRHTLFWCIFLPLGRLYSIDRAMNLRNLAKTELPTNARPPLNYQHLSWATIALICQIAWLYMEGAIYLKTGSSWQNGTSTYYALKLDFFVTDFGKSFLLRFPSLLQVLSRATLLFERWGPLLLVVPIGTSFFRLLGIFGFWCLHLGFGVSLNLGLFPYIPCCVLCALLPGSVWSLLPAVRSLPQYTLYFHADDSLAPKLARVLMQVLHVEVRMRPLQRADCSADTDTDTHNSQEQALGAAFPFLVLGTTPTQSVATDVQVGFALMKLSPLVWFRFWARVSRMLMLDRLLEFGVYLLPMSESADLFLDGLLRWQDQSRVTVWQRRALTICAFLAFVYVVNYNGLTYFPHDTPFWNQIGWIGHTFSFWQNWAMFSPDVPRQTGWFVLEATLADERVVDLFPDHGHVTAKHSKLASDMKSKPEGLLTYKFKNHRWRKLMTNLRDRSTSRWTNNDYLRYLCREANDQLAQDSQDRVKHIKFIWMMQENRDNYFQTAVQPIQVGEHSCE